MKSYFFIIMTLLPVLAYSAETEVFKCKSAGNNIVYQNEPCSPTAKQKVIQVESQTPEQREQAEAQLREWRDRQAVEDAEKAAAAQKAKEQQQQEMARQQTEQQRRFEAIQSQQQPSGINRRFGYMPNAR